MQEIVDYFKHTWKQTDLDQHVVECIKQADTILDVGCGFNQYKTYVKPNQFFWGIDFANEKADEVIDIIDYHTDRDFDLIICYGSINFYNRQWIDRRLEKVFSLLSPKWGSRICMKVNPGHPHKDGTMLDFFPWTKDLAERIAHVNNFKLENMRDGEDGRFKFDLIRPEYPDGYSTLWREAEDTYSPI